jgi:hypothetical protein
MATQEVPHTTNDTHTVGTGRCADAPPAGGNPSIHPHRRDSSAPGCYTRGVRRRTARG